MLLQGGSGHTAVRRRQHKLDGLIVFLCKYSSTTLPKRPLQKRQQLLQLSKSKPGDPASATLLSVVRLHCPATELSVYYCKYEYDTYFVLLSVVYIRGKYIRASTIKIY